LKANAWREASKDSTEKLSEVLLTNEQENMARRRKKMKLRLMLDHNYQNDVENGCLIIFSVYAFQGRDDQ
jgi:hypothetical protein